MSSILITLKSDLCAGSGESRGNYIDNDIALDDLGLPIIPGRRIKGVLSASADFLLQTLKEMGQSPSDDSSFSFLTQDTINTLFGTPYGPDGILDIQNAVLESSDQMRRWLKSGVPEPLAEATFPDHISDIFSYVRGQTAMENGSAATGSLRFTRVVGRYHPLNETQELRFRAPVDTTGFHKAQLDLLDACCKATRHIGTNRNRGLGNVKMSFEYSEDTLPSAPNLKPLSSCEEEALVKITYRLVLDTPLTVSGTEQSSCEIPARSVIGSLSSQWLQKDGHTANDSMFFDLFLNGTVSWSSLTPCYAGKACRPLPLMISKLKNTKAADGSAMFCNRLSTNAVGLDQKQSSLDGKYLGEGKNRDYYLVDVSHCMEYHHRHARGNGANREDEVLYLQPFVDSDLILSGEVYAPWRLAQDICALLSGARFRFGRSKSTQYGHCSLFGEITMTPVPMDKLTIPVGEPLYAVLESDLVLSENGLFNTSRQAVRNAIKAALPLSDSANKTDYCRFGILSGYHAMWHLQKPRIQTLCAGSVLCFVSKEDASLPRTIRLGEFKQEDMGRIRFYTQQELDAFTSIKEAQPDTRFTEQAESCNAPDLQDAVLIRACKESLSRSINTWYNNEFGNGKTYNPAHFQSGRLRLMLLESNNLKDLIDRIEAIPLSDQPSGGSGRRDLYNKLLKELYGPSPESETDAFLYALKNHCSTNKDRALCQLLDNSSKAQDKLAASWKLPLEVVLYRLHYEEKGGLPS